MKTISYKALLITAVIMLASNVKGHAQATVATNTFVAGRFLGWGTTSGNLEFKVNNNTKMVLQNTTGYFGIGTNTFTPTSLLHVLASGTQTVSCTANLLINTYTNTTTANLKKTGVDIQSTGTWTGGSNGVNVGLNVTVNGGTTNYAGLFNGGNVGIGTTTPSQILHVAKDGGAAGVQLYVQDLSATNPGGVLLGSYQGDAYIQAYASGKGIRFYDITAERMRIASGGNVGIGTTTGLLEKLFVNGAVFSNGTRTNTVYNGNGGDGANFVGSNRDWALRTGTADDFNLDVYNLGTPKTALKVLQNGNVLIGLIAPQLNAAYKLDVNGSMRANEVVVNTTGADFVFDESYKLRKLEEVEKFIKENKHLPEIQSATEMQDCGLEVGKLNTSLLQKVEEITLYMVQMNKEIQQIKAENEQLKASIKK